MTYEYPEQPPCLTPILRRRFFFASPLIRFKCSRASSDNVMAGATSAGAAVAEAEMQAIAKFQDITAHDS